MAFGGFDDSQLGLWVFEVASGRARPVLEGNYTVTFEQQDLPGEGRPDLVLLRGDRRIACEVTVTTNVEDEVAHIHKRLQAGFKHVAVISKNRKKLNRIQHVLTQGGSIPQPPGVGFYCPAEFISQLFDWATEDPEGGKAERAKPRKRDRPLDSGALTEAELKFRQEEMLNNLRRVLKR